MPSVKAEQLRQKFHNWMKQRTCKVWLGCRNFPWSLHTLIHTLLPPYSLCLVTVTKLCFPGKGFVSHTNQNKDPITAPLADLFLFPPPSPLFVNPSVLLSFNAMMSVFPLLSSPFLRSSSHSLAPGEFKGQPHRAIHTSALTTDPDKGREAVQHRSLELYRLYGLILTWLQWGVHGVYVYTSITDLCPREPALSSDLIREQLIHSRADQCCQCDQGHRGRPETIWSNRDEAATVYPTAL